MRLHRIGVALVCLALLLGCQATSRPFLRAEVEPKMVDEALRHEAEFRANGAMDAPSPDAWFEVREGTSSVLVTAPHATFHYREGVPDQGAGKNFKAPDGGTGSLARVLNEYAQTQLICTVYKSPSDPNYYDDNRFKDALRSAVTKRKPSLVLDLHASNAYRSYDVDFGTMGGASLLGNDELVTLLRSHLDAEGIVSHSDNYFAASRNQTVAKFVSALGVPCIQLEINFTWLVPYDSSTDPKRAGKADKDVAHFLQCQRFSRLLQALLRFVRAVDSQSGVETDRNE